MKTTSSRSSTPTFSSPSPSVLSETHAASGRTPAPSTSPLQLCADSQSFERWLAAHNVERREAIGCPPELIDVNATGKFDIKIPNALHPPTTNPKADALYEELRNMFTLDDALEDEYGIHKNAYLLCRTYARYKRVMEYSIEAHLRSPIDDIVQHVFEEEGRLHYEEEVAMVLPRRSEGMRRFLGLSSQSTAYIDTAVSGLANYSTDHLTNGLEWEVFDHPELHAIHIRTKACDDANNDDDPHLIALLDLSWEYNMIEGPTVRNQTVLNTAIILLHRQYVDMKSRPLWGFAVCYRTVKFYTTEWEGAVRIVPTFRGDG
ncbi:hypothetical protein EXIGLDRAFT_182522 [Exidia glandulosa HHB12029]|uniref:Uncharacterized protein n=1 Tax=Exidia glandulosa HHB12029 TaxID=1314781 RepID=A0A166A3L1_EXIGL|nr:hypothetical protein EXIGLDRAFT_182522 [Exidia glandulosa HHB12029]